MNKKIAFSTHALQRMEERMISSDNVIETIRNPEKTESSFRERMIAIRQMAERRLYVGYIEESDTVTIVTVYEE